MNDTRTITVPADLYQLLERLAMLRGCTVDELAASVLTMFTRDVLAE